MIAVIFRCGHTQRVDPDKASHACVVCGERMVARTLNAPPPRFTGTVTGPYATSSPLEAIAVRVAEQPLRLKPQDAEEPRHAR